VLDEIGAPELLRVTGQLHVYPSAGAMAKDGFGWRLREALGVRTERVDRAGLLALQPGIGERYTHAVYLPEPATIADPHGLCVRLAQALREGGVEFVRAGVDALDAGGAVHALGRAWPARASVLATGAWSAGLLRPLGVHVPLESQRGYHVQRPDLIVAPDVALERPVVAADSKTFIVPMREGVRVGGTVEFAGLDAMPTHARVALLRRCFADVFPSAPAIAPGADEREWMGHRPCLPDTLPVLGPIPGVPAIWAAFGHGHLGLTMSAVTGAWTADALLGAADEFGDEVRPLVDALVHDLRYGAPLGEALARIADQLRVERRFALEARVRRAPVVMMLPLTMCVLPAFVLLAIVPLVLGALSRLGGP